MSKALRYLHNKTGFAQLHCLHYHTMHTDERKKNSTMSAWATTNRGGKVGGKPISSGNLHFRVSRQAEEQSDYSQSHRNHFLPLAMISIAEQHYTTAKLVSTLRNDHVFPCVQVIAVWVCLLCGNEKRKSPATSPREVITVQGYRKGKSHGPFRQSQLPSNM